MYKAIIFDFDGLLVDTEIISYRIYKGLLESLGYDFTIKEYSDHYSGKTEATNVRQLIEHYRLDWSMDEGLDKVLSKEKQILAEGVKLKRGARELLEFLNENGYKTAVATSSARERAVSILKENGIYGCFDVFVFAEDIQKSKPNPDAFLKAGEKLNISSNECLVLEDSQTGIEAAVRAGMAVICIPDMKRPEEKCFTQAAAVMNDLQSVIGLLNKR